MSNRPRYSVCCSVLLSLVGLNASLRAEEPAKPAENAAEPEKPAILAGHSSHGEAFNEGPRQQAKIIPGTGKVHFPITAKDPQAQQFFDQGVGQLHGFWYLEAERSFRQVAMLDPECAMAYWGMAKANAENDKRAKEFMAMAVKFKDKASERERKYIDALDAYYKADAGKKKERAEAYVKALEAIALEHPDDIEAKAQLGLQIWLNRSNEIPITSYLPVDALLKQVLAVEPMHPCHHYLIHLWDHEKSEMALDAAAKCGPAAPGIAHMWHMPGHIYSDLHRYADAAWQQEASARVDHAYMIRDRLMPDEIHNFAHNNEWLIRNLISIGRVNDAVSLAKNMIELPRHPDLNTLKKGSSNFGRLRLFDVLSQYEMWPELIALADTKYLEATDIEAEQIKRWQHLGMANFRSGQIEQGEARIAELEAWLKPEIAKRDAAVTAAKLKVQAETTTGEPPEPTAEQAAVPPTPTTVAEGEPPLPEEEMPTPPLDPALKKKYEEAEANAEQPFKTNICDAEKAIKQLQGFALFAKGEYPAAYDKLKAAGGVDAGFLGLAQAKAGQADAAEKALRERVKKNPGELLPQLHLVELLWQLGKKPEATTEFESLRKLAANADMTAPPVARLAPIAKELELPEDWRIVAPPAADLGERPSLDSLGPYRWHPSPANAFALNDVEGKPHALQDYSGRPVIVIFYLGYGCLHCAEQLQAFGPKTQAFTDAGISLLAISTDDAEKLKKSHENYQPGVFPFPLVSDADCNVFKSYRAYDDFEQKPLHGTFFIDGQGLVRWQDIGHEPFKDVDFLLKEAQRLLALPVEAAEVTGSAVSAVAPAAK